MEIGEIVPQSPTYHLDKALFGIDSDIIDRYGSTAVTTSISSSQTIAAKRDALQYAAARGARSRFEAFNESGELRNASLKEATEWEDAARLATEREDWSLLKGKLGSHAADLREESIEEPGVKKEADAFSNLANLINP